MKFYKKTMVAVCAASALSLFSGCSSNEDVQQEPLEATAYKLNTVVTLQVYDSADSAVLDDALALCDQYEQLFSRTLETSEVYQLNHQNQDAEASISLSDDTLDLISGGLSYGRISDGAFDITIEPVSSLWDFTSEEKRVPSQEEIDSALLLVNYENVSIEGNTVSFAQQGMGLDLGAIAKGYIADKIKDFLLEKGVQSATINLGGNVLCIGNRADGNPFRIGIQRPFADHSETAAILEISDQSVVSSGIYERCFEQDGIFYHHILNPATGYPYENGLVSVTIISDTSLEGDALSTSCFALGLEKGMALIDSLPDVYALFITEDNQLHYSQGFEETITILE